MAFSAMPAIQSWQTINSINAATLARRARLGGGGGGEEPPEDKDPKSTKWHVVAAAIGTLLALAIVVTCFIYAS